MLILTRLCISLLLCLLNGYTHVEALATMSIDLGTEFFKVSIVKPGVPMEIALNVESQRKTPSVISIHDGVRLLGTPALMVAVKYPKSAFQDIPSLIGRDLDHPVVRHFQARYPYHNLSYNKETGQLVFKLNEEEYTVEELFAMLLENARDIAVNFAGVNIRAAVVTVPAHFGQAERRAVMRAARLIGLEILQLMNTNTAVALNYGVFRRKMFNATAQSYMFYDMGALGTTATIVSYQVARHRDGNTVGDHPQLHVIGVGSDPLLGTMAFIDRVRNHLAKMFNANKKLAKGDVMKNHRAMAKLTKEATRVVKVLSANTETYAQVEGLLEEEDFKWKVTRTEFEELCTDLFERIRAPIMAAVEAAQLPLPHIKEVVLMGGGSRIPRVQDTLLAITEKSELGKSVNTDEAAALGAVYQAAFHSPGFRVLTFVVKDYNPYAIAVDFERVNNDSSAPVEFVRRILFTHGNPYPQKRAITFNKQTKDTVFYVGYADVKPPMDEFVGTRMNLTNVTTSGVSQSVARRLESPGFEVRGVKAHFNLDYSGLLTLTGVETVFQPTDSSVAADDTVGTGDGTKPKSTFEKLGNTLSGLFGGSSTSDSKDDATESESVKPVASNDKTTDSNDTINAADDATNTNKQTDDKASTAKNNSAQSESSAATEKAKTMSTSNKKIKLSEPLLEGVSFNVGQAGLPEPNALITEVSMTKLQQLRLADKAKQDLERSRNELEAQLFDTRDRLTQEEFIKFSTKTERDLIDTEVTRISQWYDDQGPEVIAKSYDTEKDKLVAVLLPVKRRIREAADRPRMLTALRQAINKTQTLVELVPVMGKQARNLLLELSDLNDRLINMQMGKSSSDSVDQKAASTSVPSVTPLKSEKSTIDNDATTLSVEGQGEGEETETTKAPPTEDKKKKKKDPTEEYIDFVVEEDRSQIAQIVDDTKTWLADVEARLATVADDLTAEPPVTTEELRTKLSSLTSEADFLVGRINLWRNDNIRIANEKLTLENRISTLAAIKSDNASGVSDTADGDTKPATVPVTKMTEDDKKPGTETTAKTSSKTKQTSTTPLPQDESTPRTEL